MTFAARNDTIVIATSWLYRTGDVPVNPVTGRPVIALRRIAVQGVPRGSEATLWNVFSTFAEITTAQQRIGPGRGYGNLACKRVARTRKIPRMRGATRLGNWL